MSLFNAADVLADNVIAQNNFGDTRDGAPAGPMALFIIVALAVATVLLIRNMNARIRRLPDRFPNQDDFPRQDDERDRPATPSAEVAGSTQHRDPAEARGTDMSPGDRPKT